MDFGDLADAIGPLEYIEAAPTPPLNKLYRWSRDIMGRNLMRPQPHAEMTQFLQNSCGDFKFKDGGQKLYMLLVPRDCFKTTLGCEDLITLALKENPNLRSLIDAADHKTSKKRLYGIKWQAENNTKLRDVVGEWRPDFREDIWSNDQIVITARTEGNKDASIATGGVDRSMVGSHFELIVADDLVNDINCRTRDGRDKVYEHIFNLTSILEPNGTLVVIGTRWHWDDAYGRIIASEADRKRSGLEPEWCILNRSCYLPDGGLYFPERLTEDFLEKKRRRNATLFAANFLNQPIADEDRTFTNIDAHIEPFNFIPRARKRTVSSGRMICRLRSSSLAPGTPRACARPNDRIGTVSRLSGQIRTTTGGCFMPSASRVPRRWSWTMCAPLSPVTGSAGSHVRMSRASSCGFTFWRLSLRSGACIVSWSSIPPAACQKQLVLNCYSQSGTTARSISCPINWSLRNSLKTIMQTLPRIILTFLTLWSSIWILPSPPTATPKRLPGRITRLTRT